MKDHRLLQQRLLALFATGAVLFDFPLLKVWLAEGSVLGFPLLVVVLFVVWAGLIGTLAWLMETTAGD